MYIEFPPLDITPRLCSRWCQAVSFRERTDEDLDNAARDFPLVFRSLLLNLALHLRLTSTHFAHSLFQIRIEHIAVRLVHS